MGFLWTLFSRLRSFFSLQMPKWTLYYSQDLIKAKLEQRIMLHVLQMVVSFIWSRTALPFTCFLVSGLLVNKIHTDSALQICTNCQFTLAHLSLCWSTITHMLLHAQLVSQKNAALQTIPGMKVEFCHRRAVGSTAMEGRQNLRRIIQSLFFPLHLFRLDCPYLCGLSTLERNYSLPCTHNFYIPKYFLISLVLQIFS